MVPDSAIYIGTFVTRTQASLSLGGGIGIDGQYRKLYRSIEIEARYAGGNLIVFDDISSNSKDFAKGRIYLIKNFESTEYSEDSLMKVWSKRKPDKLEGMYEMNLSDWGNDYKNLYVKYGLIKKDESNYLMVYLSGYDEIDEYLIGSIKTGQWLLHNASKIWKEGDVFAYIQKTDKPNTFKAKKLEYNKYFNERNTIRIENGNLRFSSNLGNEYMQKIYPDSSKYEPMIGALTGFALDKYRILTCYHGVNDQNINIYVKGINGDYDFAYPAIVEKTDKQNDIAVIRLTDTTVVVKFAPFPISESPKSTAEEVFVLGYPYSNIMGEEIKLTNGIISAISGVRGDENVYQITAPVQPGNSGSPIFDKNGNLIGMVKSKITSADNVGYSIKYPIVKEFLIKNGYKINCQPENTYKDLDLSEKLKATKNSVYIIEIRDSTPKEEDDY
jgi:hypothetical protein